MTLRKIGAAIVAALCLAGPVDATVIDLTASDGGFVSSAAWSYTGGVGWEVDGQTVADGRTTESLRTSNFIAATTDNYLVSVLHSYNFQSGFDGGRLQYRVNGGSWVNIFPDTGYPVPSCATFGDNQCWSGNSGGAVTDTFTLVGVNAADTIRFRFRARWTDEVVEPGANWVVSQISFNSAASIAPVPLPASMTYGLLAIGALAGLRHYRKRKATA